MGNSNPKLWDVGKLHGFGLRGTGEAPRGWRGCDHKGYWRSSIGNLHWLVTLRAAVWALPLSEGVGVSWRPCGRWAKPNGCQSSNSMKRLRQTSDMRSSHFKSQGCLPCLIVIPQGFLGRCNSVPINYTLLLFSFFIKLIGVTIVSKVT